MIDIIAHLNKIVKVDEKGLNKVIDETLLDEVGPAFDAFIEGLDLTEADRFWILGGFVSRETEKIKEDPEAFYEFLEKVKVAYHSKKIRRK